MSFKAFLVNFKEHREVIFFFYKNFDLLLIKTLSIHHKVPFKKKLSFNKFLKYYIFVKCSK